MPVDWANIDASIEQALKYKESDTRRKKTPPKPKKVGSPPKHPKGRRAQMQWWRKDHSRGHNKRVYDYPWDLPKADPYYLRRIEEWYDYDVKAALYEWETGEDYVQRYKAPPSSKPKVEKTRFPIVRRYFGDTWLYWAWGPADDPRRKRHAPFEPKKDSDLEEGRRLLKRLEEEVCY